MNAELKPCPFCGAAAVRLRIGHTIKCSECDSTAWGLKTWNRRAAPDAPAVQSEPVAWAVCNGVRIHGLVLKQESANDYAKKAQMDHDLSGSLAAFKVRPLVYGDTPVADHSAHDLDMVQSEPVAVYDLPQGWEATHAEPWHALTKEAAERTRFSVKRTEPPFCGKDGIRIWSGPTLDAALRTAYAALKLQFPEPNQPAADPVADKLAEALRVIAYETGRLGIARAIARAALAEWEQKGGGE